MFFAVRGYWSASARKLRTLGVWRGFGGNHSDGVCDRARNSEKGFLSRNAFLLYMPPGNAEAMVHYQDTIKNKVPLSRIEPFIDPRLRKKLSSTFCLTPIAVWGSRAGERNRSSFESMAEGDDVLIVEGDSVKLLGKIAAKVQSKELSTELWQPLRGKSGTPWELIYFIANPRELDVPFSELKRLLGYKPSFRLQGFTRVAANRLGAFDAKYGDLYSALLKLEAREQLSERMVDEPILAAEAPPELVEVGPDEINEILKTPFISDHITMQWKLARLGIKAGEKVWVPVGDQTKLRQVYKFDSFDSEFAAGIDLPHSYVENIDVVWKQEFRIGAAYEIENSTSIYSGLLRFADLNIIAPNSVYPLFIVAPRNRKNRVQEQVRRPTFKKLELDRKVRFLPYETINEIDDFFADADSGLNIELIVNKSESLTRNAA